MKKYIEIIIQSIQLTQAELLIAELSDIGYDGFLEEEHLLKAYMDATKFDENKLINLMNKHELRYSLSDIKEQNWNALWESNFNPVMVDDFVGIRAFFHEPMVGFEHELIITPKMSFGTGHHATTYSVIQLMKPLNFKDKTVFDFGTGTGILAILAEKLGSSKILAVDNDTWCIENASENILINDCKYIDIQLVDSINNEWRFDIVIANINRHIIEANLSSIYHSLHDNGDLILSGLLNTDESAIIDQCIQLGFKYQKTVEKDGWIALYLTKQ
jgi:ribosomal protein L11 methyltransferase